MPKSLTTRQQKISPKFDDYVFFNISLREILDYIEQELLYTNDLQALKPEAIPNVRAGLIQATLLNLDLSPYYHFLTDLKSEKKKFQWDEKLFEVLVIDTDAKIFDIRCLRTHYTPETLSEIITDIQYLILKEVNYFNPNVMFYHPVYLMYPVYEVIKVGIHKEDLKEAVNDSDLSNDPNTEFYHTLQIE